MNKAQRRYIVAKATKCHLAEEQSGKVVQPVRLRSREPPLMRSFCKLFYASTKNAPCLGAFLLAQRRGFSPLAARPAPPLSMAVFAVELLVIVALLRQSILLSQNGSHPQILFKIREKTKKRDRTMSISFLLAQRRGFEPPVSFWPTHDFQSCSLNHSDISAYKAHHKPYYITVFFRKMQAFLLTL